MTTTSIKMTRHFIARLFLTTTIAASLLVSCKKNDPPNSNEVASYSSEVLDKWMVMQVRLMKNTTGVPNQAFSRHFVYAGIAAYESVAPGLNNHSEWSSKWNGLAGLPVAEHAVKYYYPANVNAAMAAINKAFFPNATAVDKAAIDSLETALNQSFLAVKPAELINKSSAFGKAVSAAVFNWSESDGYKNASNAYTPPVGPGLWKPTPPAMASAVSPYWGNNRTVITGSIDNTQPTPPISYSTEASSPFYQMAKEVYDVSQVLTSDQIAMALFWRDVPGVSSPGHWLSIVQQVIQQSNAKLDRAVLAYALTGAAINDALISCWKTKYQYNVVRPITYIREVMGYSTWNSYLGTPAHPDYSSGHAVLSAAAAGVMDKLFSINGSFTDHTYDYLGFAPRTYTSFNGIAEEAAKSRLYAGIHYKFSLDTGLVQGRKVTANIFLKIK